MKKKIRGPKSIKSEMKEKLQLVPQKYKGSQEITINKDTPIKLTTQKKWTNSWKCTHFQLNQEETENMNRPITSNEIESVI